MKTTENNKLIAEFMGGKEKKQSPLFGQSFIEIDTTNMDCYVSLPKYVNPNALKYHKSWDWLMPVVEKIEELGYWVNRHNGDVYIINNDGDIITPTPMSDGGKDMYYQAVVEFIKWYNKNK